VDDGDRFFARRWPEVRAISDADGSLSDAFGHRRGSWGQVLGPRAALASLGALLRGAGLGKVRGDPRRLPGFLLVRGDEVLWEHPSRHAADHPDLASIATLAASFAEGELRAGASGA
jgi:hypothetical protein